MTIILICLTVFYIYEREVLELIHNTRFDRKPFNCVFCLSVWTGVAITIFTGDLIYLSLPLLNRITQIKLLR